MRKSWKIALTALCVLEWCYAVVFVPTERGAGLAAAWTLAGAILQGADALLRALHKEQGAKRKDGDAMA